MGGQEGARAPAGRVGTGPKGLRGGGGAPGRTAGRRGEKRPWPCAAPRPGQGRRPLRAGGPPGPGSGGAGAIASFSPSSSGSPEGHSGPERGRPRPQRPSGPGVGSGSEAATPTPRSQTRRPRPRRVGIRAPQSARFQRLKSRRRLRKEIKNGGPGLPPATRADRKAGRNHVPERGN